MKRPDSYLLRPFKIAGMFLVVAIMFFIADDLSPGPAKFVANVIGGAVAGYALSYILLPHTQRWFAARRLRQPAKQWTEDDL